MTSRLLLVAPAGTPAAFDAAIESGADAVYVGFRDETNARNFAGLNFTREELKLALARAHSARAAVYVAVNTYPRPGAIAQWTRAVDDAAGLGADAVILADVGLLDYASRRHPELRLHLSVQASAANSAAIGLYAERFGVRRVVLPRVLTVQEIGQLASAVKTETEVFAFGGYCVMAEGRCSLSGYATGRSPNMDGVCSPSDHVHYWRERGHLHSSLGSFTIDVFKPDQKAAYPTFCKGRFAVEGKPLYLFEEPASLNAISLLPLLMKAGVTALKIEGRQRGKTYIAQVVRSFRRAIDAAAEGRPIPNFALDGLTEGNRGTIGAYERHWR